MGLPSDATPEARRWHPPPVSDSFYVPFAAPPTFSELDALLAQPGFVWSEEEDILRAWPQSVLHCRLARKSARSVELTWHDDDGQVSVRLMTCSARADLALGLEIVRRLAGASEGVFEGEDGLSGTVSQLDALGADWLDHQYTSGAAALLAIATDARGPITLPGAVRAYHATQTSLATLEERATAGSRPFADVLTEDIIRVQNISFEGVLEASVIQARSEDGPPRTLSVLGPGIEQYLVAADQIAVVPAVDEVPLFIPWASAKTLLGGLETWVDGASFRFPALQAKEWDDLLGRAHAILGTEPPPATPTAWQRFLRLFRS